MLPTSAAEIRKLTASIRMVTGADNAPISRPPKPGPVASATE